MDQWHKAAKELLPDYSTIHIWSDNPDPPILSDEAARALALIIIPASHLVSAHQAFLGKKSSTVGTKVFETPSACLILDEAHHFRNPNGLQNAVRELCQAKNANAIILCTGTPITSHLQNILSIASATNLGEFASSPSGQLFVTTAEATLSQISKGRLTVDEANKALQMLVDQTRTKLADDVIVRNHTTPTFTGKPTTSLPALHVDIVKVDMNDFEKMFWETRGQNVIDSLGLDAGVYAHLNSVRHLAPLIKQH